MYVCMYVCMYTHVRMYVYVSAICQWVVTRSVALSKGLSPFEWNFHLRVQRRFPVDARSCKLRCAVLAAINIYIYIYHLFMCIIYIYTYIYIYIYIYVSTYVPGAAKASAISRAVGPGIRHRTYY